MNANKNIALIEDHHQALGIWRKKGFNGLPLVHLDAHIDFGFYPAKPIQKVFNEARSLKELKRGLEYSLAFMHYEKDFNKQTDIGNYIYPAMEDGIVKNFYWVIPGGDKEFKRSRKELRALIKNLAKQDPYRVRQNQENGTGELRACHRREPPNSINTSFMGRRFVITTLEHLPVLNDRVLVDIDMDFLVVDSLKNADATSMIGKRKPWIHPEAFVGILRKKIKNPAFITIAYSVNGGWTPIKYKHLGDEIAYYLAPEEFKSRLNNNSQAAEYFNLFTSTGKKEYYQKSVGLNPTYRVADNNYGPLYLSLRKFSRAQDEFLKVLRVDPKNPACLLGLGNLYLERKDFKKAKRYFSSALNSENHRLFTPLENSLTGFTKVKNQTLYGLANAEFELKHFDKAKKLLYRYQTIEPLQPQSYYLLGRIFEKEKDFERSTLLYKDAIRLGFGSLEPISRLLKLSSHVKEKDAIIKYVIAKYKEFKKGFTRTKRLSLKKGKKVTGLREIEKKMVVLEKRLERIKTRLKESLK